MMIKTNAEERMKNLKEEHGISYQDFYKTSLGNYKRKLEEMQDKPPLMATDEDFYILKWMVSEIKEAREFMNKEMFK